MTTLGSATVIALLTVGTDRVASDSTVCSIHTDCVHLVVGEGDHDSGIG